MIIALYMIQSVKYITISSLSALSFLFIFRCYFFFFKQKTAYEMRISDWSSDVCSSDLHGNMSGGYKVNAFALMVDDEHAAIRSWLPHEGDAACLDMSAQRFRHAEIGRAHV